METLPSAHPEMSQLQAFNRGLLEDEAASTEIAAHLDSCADCRRKLESLAADTLENLVRQADTVQAPAVAKPPPFTDHPRYEIEKLLGAGGMGSVYRARHKLMNRDVALKVINPRLVDRPQAVDRFRREVRAAAQLSHPNIVAAHDAEQFGDVHFLVMEYVPGASLAEIVEQRGPLPVNEACHYVCQAALGLQHAHERGLVHRDIKPGNLMLADWGLPIADSNASGRQSAIPNPQSAFDHHSHSIVAGGFELTS
jgi:serine/threonine protein kinase